jgi:DNA-binding transcriptional regulator YiaG
MVKQVVDELDIVQFYAMSERKQNNRKAKVLESNEQVYAKIGKRIKDLRLKAGYSNAEKFAFENEITRSQYAMWEKGQDMKISSLLRITRAHDITINEFFEGIE